jgi:endoglucanase
VGVSFPFTIGARVQQPVAKAVLKGYYYMRASMPLERAYAGKWARPAGHPDTAVLVHASAASVQRPAGTKIATPGGWYDAGDYNKYVVNSGISTGTLLSAYEDFPAYFDTLRTNIPESRDRIPDILNEAIYNLRWMLSMQDPNDGGVYNKCTNAAFDGMVMPGVTKLPRYVVQKGTAATLDLAAVAAQAARILRKYDKQLPGLADSCLLAARRAWDWAQLNPVLEYNQNEMNRHYEPRISTGGYGDRRFADEWNWAACELYASTKAAPYEAVVKERLNDSLSLPSWGNVSMLGYYTLLRMGKTLPLALAALRKRLTAFSDRYLQPVAENAFKTVMGGRKNDFNWGSNANAANQAIVLINAWFIAKDRKYIDQALGNLDYLLGRNATGYCFVTGIGSRSTRHPHHRPSVADGIDDPVPGLLAGGPNPGRQDHCLYEFTEPETAYSDTDCAYASNEVAINWNAPLVYLANALEALQYRIEYSK